MAATLRTPESDPQFDWEFAEAQFPGYQQVDTLAEAAGYTRPPESEIYGRSLSTPRRLGALMIKGMLAAEAISSPEAAQAKVEFFTSVEEGLGTDKKLGRVLEVRDFDMRPVLNGRVVSKDLKTAISDMTDAGLRCAEETAKKDRRFLPQLIRSRWDHRNALIVDEMVRGETGYNLRIVASPFPEEAAAKSGNEYWRNIGYVPHLRRGFVQLYCATKDGLLAGSLSFDGSNKRRLREVFAECDIEIPEGEVTDNWLKYAITRTLPESQAKALAIKIADMAGDPAYKKNTNTVDVTKQYRPIMERVFNESYVHICESLTRKHQTKGTRELVLQLTDKAGDFNERYGSALYGMRANKDQFTDDDFITLHELLVYSTIEMMRALHVKKLDADANSQYTDDAAHLSALLHAADSSSFQNLLGGFGAEGARNNRTYSACGLSISLGDDDPETNPQTAFGGLDGASAKPENKAGWQWKRGICQVKACPSPKPTEVGPCSVCRRCQAEFDAGRDPTRGSVAPVVEPAKPKATGPLTWEQAFGIKPKTIASVGAEVGKRALVGSSA